MKETNIWLSAEELEHMLRGSLQWTDIASRVAISNTGIRKLDQTIFKKQLAPKQAEDFADNPAKEKDKSIKRFEGQPVIWLLGSVGLLTLSSWFYYVLFGK